MTTSPFSSSETSEACLTMFMVAELRGKRSDLTVHTHGEAGLSLLGSSGVSAPVSSAYVCVGACLHVYMYLCSDVHRDGGWYPLKNTSPQQSDGEGDERVWSWMDTACLLQRSLNNGLRWSGPETGAVYAVSACTL